MQDAPRKTLASAGVALRTSELLAQARQGIVQHVDRLFGVLMVAQFVAAICMALFGPPGAWEGSPYDVRLHVWAALTLGAAIISPPILLAFLWRGNAATRHTIAVAQMLMGALLVHLAGGRVETQFYVFGSMALLGFYRDWRVLITSMVVVALDHFLCGVFRHAAWIIVEDLFLIYWCVRGEREMKSIAARQAQWEDANARLEDNVRKRTNELAISEARFRTFVDHATDAFYLIWKNGVILDANRQACVSLGRTREELIGATQFAFDAELNQPLFDHRAERLAAGETVVFETHHRHKDGSVFPVEVRARPFEEAGQFFVVCLARDITERQRAEQALNASEKRHAGLVNNLDAVVWERDASTMQFRFVSPQAERILGYPLRRWLDEPDFWSSHIHPDDRDWIVKFCIDRMCAGEDHNLEYRMVAADGQTVWLKDYVSVESVDGQATTLRGVMVDLTERKQAEEALRESEERLRIIWMSEPECVQCLSRDCIVEEINPAGLAMMDAESTEEVVGRSVLSVVDPPYREAFQGLTERVFRGETGRLEFAVTGLKGTRRWLETHAVPLFDPTGAVRSLLGVTRDITTRKRAEEAVQGSLREKDALLKEIHHRVKNNLQIISSLLHLQIPKIKDAESLSAFQDSQNRVRSMALIHETLYRSGDFAGINLSNYVDTLCSNLFRTYGVDASRTGLAIRVANTPLDVDRAIPCGLIINELVSNSLKYAFPNGRAGRIAVEMQRDANSNCVLMVADDGVGLPANLDLEQLDSLGLNLVTDLTGQLGGSLEIERENGAAFRITFPMVL